MSCCSRSRVRNIKVGRTETGIIALDQILHSVYISGLVDESAVRKELLALTRKFGNYVAPSKEDEYGEALLREYRNYVGNVESGGIHEV